jgi:copper(I)-binding protein
MVRQAEIMRCALSLTLLILLPALGAAAGPPAGPAAAPAKPTIERAWARATARGVPVTAVYFTIRNPGSRADQVVTLSSPAGKRAEMHETKMSGGIMQMRQITNATVPARGALVLEPGGTHVMLIGLRSPLAPGAKLPLVLTFRHAGEVQVDAVVLAPGSDPPSQ